MFKYQLQIKILLCFSIITAVIIFDRIEAAFGQTSKNWTIHPQVTDSGGGACDSENYRLCFSLGQASPVGVCESGTKCLSAGFITGAAKTAQTTETSTDSSSGSSSSCFIRSLLTD